MRLDDGELVIGRSAGLRLADRRPVQYVSRAHCTVAGRSGAFTVTDTSSDGLFVDDARAPLGPGRPLPLRDGMRLRLGDYVVRVELPAPEAARRAAGGSRPRSRLRRRRASSPSRGRSSRARSAPATCPIRSSRRRASCRRWTPRRRNDAGRPVFDDPFTLDPPTSSRHRERPAPPEFDPDAGTPPAAASRPRRPRTSTGARRRRRAARRRRPRRRRASSGVLRSRRKPGGAGGLRLGRSFGTAAEPPASAPSPGPPRRRAAQPPSAPSGGVPLPGPSAPAAGPDALFDAFLRGLGLDAADAPAGDPAARMEAFGREYRMMAEGLMQLLRLRAQEKGNARIAADRGRRQRGQSAEVHADRRRRARGHGRAPRSGGFSGDRRGDRRGAARSRRAPRRHLARERRRRSRRLIDRFDPAALESELEALGLLETLLAGGRRAKLWELYQKRFRDHRPERRDPVPRRGRRRLPRSLREGGIDMDRRAFLALPPRPGCSRPAAARTARPGGGHRRRRPAAPGMNPGPDGADRPVTLSLLRLKDAGAFMSADMFALQEDPAAALAADLIGMDQLPIAPGGTASKTHHLRARGDAARAPRARCATRPARSGGWRRRWRRAWRRPPRDPRPQGHRARAVMNREPRA